MTISNNETAKGQTIVLFQDRYDAGQQLVRPLREFKDDPTVVVLGLPRGGVPVAYEVAQALHLPLDIFLVRKLGVPGEEELAMGAIASDYVRVLNYDVIDDLKIKPRVIEGVTRQEHAELIRRENAYRGNRPPLQVKGQTVLLIDDGLATGMTMSAAVYALRRQNPYQIVVAVPVAARDTCVDIAKIADRVVCFKTPYPFWNVGRWYDDFSPTADEEVRDLLARTVLIPSTAPMFTL